ncbi:hypothetical protein [Psychromonas sp. GE-S-Ul-11]
MINSRFIPFIFLVSLTGCEVLGPSIKVTGPKVIIDDSEHRDVGHTEKTKSKGTFCPPG